MSFDNIADIVRVLSQEPDKLSDNELADLYIFLTGSDETILAKVENSCNRLQTNSAKLRYLRGLLENSKSDSVAGLSTTSIDDAISEAKKLFNCHSRVLIEVAKNTYKPYSAFSASENNKYKESIDKKNLPVINGQLNLLLHNLPEEGEKGLTDYESFKEHVTESHPRSNKTIVLGTSGCGKTRLCFETLCHNFGLYLIAFPYGIGSSDLEESARWTRDNIENKSAKDAERIAVQAVISCIVGRLLLLQHLFGVAEEHNATMVPKSWLFLQLNHIIFRELRLIFRDVTEFDSLNCCSHIIKDLEDRGLLKEIFPVVYDEAQAHTTYLPATFPSAQLSQERARAFFSVVVRSLASSVSSISKAIICITGSGLSLLRARDEISSRAKLEPHVPTFNNFGRIETSDELFELIESIIPLKEEEKEVVLSAIYWLKGRYRWSWTWIHYLISSDEFDPEKQLMSLVENLTTKAESLSNREYSIYTGFENLEKYPPNRPPNINNVATLELMKSAFVTYSMTGRPITFTSNDEMDIMNLGFAHIKNIQKFTCVIDEPLVIQTAFNYFKRNQNDAWFRLMSQTNFNASMAGLIWEKIVVNFLREKLFESNTALSESRMFHVTVKLGKKDKIIKKDKKYYLPEDFERPSQLLPCGDNCMGRIAVESTTADNYLEWLRAVAEWEKTGNVPKGFCPICYPPNMAGPDISIAFYFPRAEDDMQLDEERKSYILNVQVKLRNKAMIKESFNTVEPSRMFLDKNGKSNPPKANATLNKIYKDQGWFKRNMKMIVIYPCNPQRKFQYQQTPGASSRERIIPRVIIDMDNASTLFPDDCQEWIKEYKKKVPDGWEDCSDIEDELDDLTEL